MSPPGWRARRMSRGVRTSRRSRKSSGGDAPNNQKLSRHDKTTQSLCKFHVKVTQILLREGRPQARQHGLTAERTADGLQFGLRISLRAGGQKCLRDHVLHRVTLLADHGPQSAHHSTDCQPPGEHSDHALADGGTVAIHADDIQAEAL